MQALSEGKQRIELIVGAMTEGVMVLDNSGRISMTNRAARDLLDSNRDFSGKTLFEVFRDPKLDDAVRQVRAGASPVVVEMTIGAGRTIQANVAPVANTS